jgi:glycosyltransferase involved in cell wall biosynthesis
LLRGIVRGRSAILGRFYTPSLYQRAKELALRAPVDVLQIEYIHNAVYRDVAEAVRVLDLHDVASEQARKIAAIQAPPLNALYWLESHAIERKERAACCEYDVIACVSQHDAELLGDGVRIAPNGWDATEPLGEPSGNQCAFVANFAFSTNVDAAQWLAREIWPRVRRELGDAKLWLVGKDPAPQVLALHGRDGITVTGTVADVAPYLERSRVALAPLRAGSGSRLKILEALEASRPIVSTGAGLEGLEALSNAGVVLADEPADFAREVVALLRDPARARALGDAGRRAVHRTFLWDATLKPMFDAIDQAVARRK